MFQVLTDVQAERGNPSPPCGFIKVSEIYSRLHIHWCACYYMLCPWTSLTMMSFCRLRVRRYFPSLHPIGEDKSSSALWRNEERWRTCCSWCRWGQSRGFESSSLVRMACRRSFVPQVTDSDHHLDTDLLLKTLTRR